MATNEIEIEVTLDAKKAEKGLASLEKEGESIGDTFSGLGEVVKSVGGEMGEKMLEVGETFGGVRESVIGLGTAMSSAGSSFTSLIGPIGLVTVALIEAYRQLEQFFINAEQAEIRVNAYEEGLSDLKSTTQELTLAGVDLSRSESRRIIQIRQRIHELNAEADAIQKGTKETQERIRANRDLIDSHIAFIAAQTQIIENVGGPEAPSYRERNDLEEKRNELLGEQIVLEERLKSTRGENAETIKAEIATIKTKLIPIEEKLSRTRQSTEAQRIYALNRRALRQAKLNKEVKEGAELEQKRDEELAKAQNLYKEAAKSEKELNDLKEKLAKRSTENLEKRAKLEAQITHEAQIKSLQAQEQTEKTKTQIAVLQARRRAEQIQGLEDVSQEVKDSLMVAEDRLLKRRLQQIAEDERKAQELRAKQSEALRRMSHAKHLAAERQKQLELARISRAEIENQRINGESQLKILAQQEALELKLVGDNERAKEAIRLEFANRRLVFQEEQRRKTEEQAQQDAEDARRLAEEERQRAEQRQAFILDSMEFDLNMRADSLDKELALLDLRYRREIELSAKTEEERTELKRRAELERAKIIQESATNEINAIVETTSALRDGLAESAYNALFFGESFKKGIGEILLSLGRQAAVESLMELAKGTAALFLNPAAAANHFAASGIYGAAAIAAGSAGSALGGGGGGGASASATSPTGSPQSAPAPERERAESNAMVFNINFGNSTIYDTKRAAQDAFAAEIMRTFNRQRRGAPRFAMG